MATERDYQGLYDRIAALRDTVASRLASDLITNPQLADALTKQIDDMLQSVVDADARCRRRPTRASPNWPASAPRPPTISARRGCRRVSRRTTKPSPPSGSSPSATSTTSIPARKDRRLPCRAETAGAVPRRRGAAVGRRRRLRALSVRPARGAALHPARPPGGLPPHLQLRRRPRAGRRPAQHRFPQALRAISSIRSRCSGATSGSPT